MRKLEIIKIEGGIPQDEKRELVRALTSCPLKKIVMIGVNSPLGNSWNVAQRDMTTLPDGLEDYDVLDEENEASLLHMSCIKTDPIAAVTRFEPAYGDVSHAPILHIIAAHHAPTVTELKFCGFRGSTELWGPLPITSTLLSSLRQFHNLQEFVLSLWLPTSYEGDHNDDEIIDYWLDMRSSSSTALVPTEQDHLSGWALQLHTLFNPERIARRILTLIGPFLSERAKVKKSGVHVRGSCCVGYDGTMFDFDVDIGKSADGMDRLIAWKGPREELHPERRKEKLDSRRWF